MIQLLLIGLLALSCTVRAKETLNPPGLLPPEIARRLLEQDPGVAQARYGEAMRQVAR